MIKSVLPCLVALALLEGCVTATRPQEPPIRTQADTCQAARGQAFIGQAASAEAGAAIMAATHATRLRWVPPHTAVTMEYAFGRVTVGYGDDYKITAVGCN